MLYQAVYDDKTHLQYILMTYNFDIYGAKVSEHKEAVKKIKKI